MPVLPQLLVAVTVKLKIPPVVGVPLMTPVLVLRLSPPGKEPLEMAHDVIVPPDAANVCEYVVPTIPLGNDVVLIVTVGQTEMLPVTCDAGS